jgi:hypothetical protein
MLKPLNLDSSSIIKRLQSDSQKSMNWKINLNCFILKIIPIHSLNLIWVVSSENQVFVIDINNGNVVHQFVIDCEFIFCAVSRLTSQSLIVATSNGIFSLFLNGDSQTLTDENGWFEHMAINKDENLLFASNGKTLFIFESVQNEFKILKKDNSFKSTISDVLFSHNSFLVSCYGGVREYSSSDLDHFNSFEWKTSLLAMSWSPDKKYISASTQENAIHFWPYPFEKNSDFQMSGYHSKITKMIWSKDSTKFIVNCFEDVHIWDFSDGPATGKQPITLKGGIGKITDIYFENKLIVAVNENGFIFYYVPSESEQFVSLQSIDDQITCLNMDAGESLLFLGCQSGNLYSINMQMN